MAKKSEPKEAKNEMPITVTERKKAEELVKAKFANLEKTIRAACDEKEAQLNREWARRSGLAKLQQQLKAANEKVSALEKEIEALTDNMYSGATHAKPRKEGALAAAIDRLHAAEQGALEKLRDKQLEATKELWLGMLSTDALKIIDAIPSAKELKQNGLKLLDTPVKKLLGTK